MEKLHKFTLMIRTYLMVVFMGGVICLIPLAIFWMLAQNLIDNTNGPKDHASMRRYRESIDEVIIFIFLLMLGFFICQVASVYHARRARRKGDVTNQLQYQQDVKVLGFCVFASIAVMIAAYYVRANPNQAEDVLLYAIQGLLVLGIIFIVVILASLPTGKLAKRSQRRYSSSKNRF